MNRYVFLERGNSYNQVEANFTVKESIDKGIYNMCYDGMKQEIYLEKIGEKFEFPFKLYGVHKKLVNSVKNYFNSTKGGNLGVLLNGTRGTGKTVTAKVIANELNLPVIIVSSNFPNLTDFIAKCQQDIIFFFDEFEKNFAGRNDHDEYTSGEQLLSVMDGVYNSSNRHVFLLTTNNLRINENFLSRPSRIRYRHTFGNVLDQETLKEFLQDTLKNQSRINEVIEFVNLLEIATIDIVKSVVEEVNIQDCDPKELKDIFNVDVTDYKIFYHYRTIYSGDKDFETYSLTKFAKECATPYEEREYKYNISMDSDTFEKPFTSYKIGENFRWEGDIIKEIDYSNKTVMTIDSHARKHFMHIDSESKSNQHNYSLVY